jgi:hypothetical protein
VTARIVIAATLLIVLAAVAWWLELRRRREVPSQGAPITPVQLDRGDFPSKDTPWLVVLFTSDTCASCEGLYDKAVPLAGAEVAVVEVGWPAQRALHDRYQVHVAPLTLVADRDGVVHATFIGAFHAPDLWSAVAELRNA